MRAHSFSAAADAWSCERARSTAGRAGIPSPPAGGFRAADRRPRRAPGWDAGPVRAGAPSPPGGAPAPPIHGDPAATVTEDEPREDGGAEHGRTICRLAEASAKADDPESALRS